VRLWTWEAFAHGAELVSYFRWRQCPYAQEQMHSGLHAPDNTLSQGGREVAQVGEELRALGAPHDVKKHAPVALLFDYEADWMVAAQPHGADFDYQHHVFEWYSALRSLGLDVDIVSAHADVAGYRLVVAPTLPILPDSVIAQIERGASHWIFGPRTGSKTGSFAIAPGLPPGKLQGVLPVRIAEVESLRPSIRPAIRFEGTEGHGLRWRDHAQPGTGADVLARFDDGVPALLRHGRVNLVTACFDQAMLRAIVARCVRDAGIESILLPEGLRLRTRGPLRFAINYSDEPHAVPAPHGARFVLGGPQVEPVGVAAWIEDD
jgi:beta-galactosidase